MTVSIYISGTVMTDGESVHDHPLVHIFPYQLGLKNWVVIARMQ